MFSLFLATDNNIDLFLSNPKEEAFLFLEEFTVSSFYSLLLEIRFSIGYLLE